MAHSTFQNLRTTRHLQEQSRIMREVKEPPAVASKASSSLSHHAQVALLAAGLLMLLFVALLRNER